MLVPLKHGLNKCPDQRPPNASLLSIHPTSPSAQAGSSIPRPDSTSTPRSGLSLSTSQPSISRHPSWQQTPSSISSSAASSTPTLSAPGTMQIGSTLTTWRSHESSASVHSNPGQMHDPSQSQTQAHYGASNSHDRPQWSGTTHSYSYQDQQRNQQFEGPGQPQVQYGPTSVPTYAPGTTPQQAGYAAPPQPPQAEFQGMAVSSPAAYHQGFPPPAQYPMATMQVSPAPNNPEYTPPQGHMQPPPISAASYHAVQGDQQYSQHQMQANMQFRDDPSDRGYSLTHYPSG